MAERRMFAKSIIDSDAFLALPISSQALYFHLSMRADDDGFVNKPRAIMNMLGAKDDDMKILIAKKFVIGFESGVVVIKHWRIHNYIQSDRYKETNYKFEKSSLYLDENKAYSTNPQTPVCSLDTECIQTVSTLETQVRLGKDSIGKNSIGQTIDGVVESDPFEIFWNAYPKKVSKETAREAFSKCTQPLDILITAIEKQKQSAQWNKENGRYIPNPATWLSQGRWSDEVEAVVGKATATAQSESFRKSVSKFMSEDW